jgi:hypothetical protein
MRRLVSFMLMLTLIMSFVACAKSEKPKGNEKTDVSETEENPFEEFFEISWLTQLNEDYQEGRWDELELEELFNVDLKVLPMCSYTDYEGMAALVASGDMPDFSFMPAAPRQPQDLYNEGIIRSVPLQAIKDFLPGMYELLEKMPIGFKYNLVEGKTDEYLGITHINFQFAQWFNDTTSINLDWLEAIGYSVDLSQFKQVKIPTAGYERFNDNLYFGEGNFSFEEMQDIMKKFTEDDPDRNGIDDTFGMMYLPETANSVMTQEGLFGFVITANYLYKDPVTGDVVPYYAYTPYRDYLAWVSDSLQKGYMRRLPGQDTWVNEYFQISKTNKVGIIQSHANGYLQLTSFFSSWPPQNIWLETDEDATFIMGPMFKGPEGKAVNMTYGIDTFGSGAARVEMFGAQVSDAKMERVLRMLQYMIYTSEEIFTRYQYGLEGIHFKWSGEPYKSTKIITPQEDLPPEYRGNVKVFTCWLMQWPTAQLEIDNAINNGYWSCDAYMYYYGLNEKMACNPEKYIADVYMGRELYNRYVEINNEVGPQITTVVNNFKNRALNGEIANFNSEWVQYIDQLYAAGLRKLVDEIFNRPDYEKYNPGDKFKIMAPLY